MSDETAEKQSKPIEPNYRLAGLPLPTTINPYEEAIRPMTDEENYKHEVKLLSEKILLEIIGQRASQVLDEDAQDEIIKISQSMAEKFISANEQKEGETNG